MGYAVFGFLGIVTLVVLGVVWLYQNVEIKQARSRRK